jgi:serine/threonine-protein kinase
MPSAGAGARGHSSPRSSSGSFEEGRFLPGTMLAARYRIFGIVGKGGMGEVYRADDLKLGQTVALKFLPAEVEMDAERLERFLAEVRIARTISHPNVCRVYDVGEVDGHHFLTMEFVDGEDLASLLRRIGRLPRDKALQIARQLCAGLAAAHEQGILHRDLKPANIMIDGRGRARITDFGLARLAGEIRGADLLSGTPAFMAPEQIAGKSVTVRSDLYSLGLVLYELCTGQPAFKATSAAEMARLKNESTPTSPGQIVEGFDPAVERVIMRCLEHDPANRPASALSVAASLPGGDPLAAALAAGETPSPELVAEAGAVGGLTPFAAWACIGALAVGLFLLILLAGHAQIGNLVPLDKPPEALVERAGQILHRLGYDDKPYDSTFFFTEKDDFINRLAHPQIPPDPWERLSTGPPFAIEFCYRQSPEPLIPLNMIAARPNEDDPPATLAGMIDVRLDPEGRLRALHVVPPERDAPAGLAEAGVAGASAAAEPDWNALLSEAGLDPATLRKVEPDWRPPVYADRRAAWEGNYAPATPTEAASAGTPSADTAFRIEAASYRGRPVAFRFIDSWTKSLRTETTVRKTSEAILQAVAFLVGVTLIAGGAFIARRNIRLGRGDRKGALRLAAFSFMTGMLYWVLRAHHVAGGAEFARFITRAGYSLALGGLVWTCYLALEPPVRRLWPKTIVSWVRLLDGRLTDPLVGRDLVIGLLAGVFFTILRHGLVLAPARFGLPSLAPNQQGPEFQILTLTDFRSAAGLLFLTVDTSLLIPMATMVLLLLFRTLFRKTWITFVALIVLTGLAGPVSTGNKLVDLAYVTLAVLLHVWLLFQFGLLVIVVAECASNVLGLYQLTFQFGSWQGGNTVLVLLLFAALAAFGVRAALAGRSPFGDTFVPGARTA